MQKILQFPILGVKENYFTDKINVYNQTFAQLDINSKCLLSHEEEMHKKSCDIANFYYVFCHLCAVVLNI